VWGKVQCITDREQFDKNTLMRPCAIAEKATAPPLELIPSPFSAQALNHQSTISGKISNIVMSSGYDPNNSCQSLLVPMPYGSLPWSDFGCSALSEIYYYCVVQPVDVTAASAVLNSNIPFYSFRHYGL
jgi:hypothetical protein